MLLCKCQISIFVLSIGWLPWFPVTALSRPHLFLIIPLIYCSQRNMYSAFLDLSLSASKVCHAIATGMSLDAKVDWGISASYMWSDTDWVRIPVQPWLHLPLKRVILAPQWPLSDSDFSSTSLFTHLEACDAFVHFPALHTCLQFLLSESPYSFWSLPWPPVLLFHFLYSSLKAVLSFLIFF